MNNFLRFIFVLVFSVPRLVAMDYQLYKFDSSKNTSTLFDLCIDCIVENRIKTSTIPKISFAHIYQSIEENVQKRKQKQQQRDNFIGAIATKIVANEEGVFRNKLCLEYPSKGLKKIIPRVFDDERFSDVETVNLSGNGLTKLPSGRLVGLTALKSLYLGSNPIKRIY